MKTTILLLSLAFASAANAELLTYEFSGKLTQVVSDTIGLAATWGSLGDPFCGTISYDPAWHNSNGGQVSEDTEVYYYNNQKLPPEAIIAMSLSTPSQHRSIPGAVGFTEAWVTDNPTNGTFVLAGEYFSGYFMALRLVDATGAAVSDTSLPTNLNLSDWPTSHYVDITGLPYGGYVRGDIETLQQIPEPDVTGLVLVGLMAFAFYRRLKPNTPQNRRALSLHPSRQTRFDCEPVAGLAARYAKLAG